MSRSDSKIIIFTSPSGAGKSTITKHLLKTFPFLAFSISATTRNKRDGEVHAKDYYFLSVDEFQENIDADAFLEYEQVYEGLYYGTLVSEIDRLNDLNKVAVLDIDVDGARNVKKRFGERVLTVFVAPPSKQVLIDRLKKRNTESAEELQKRVERMEYELKQQPFFDKVIVNDQLEVALQEAEEIVQAFCPDKLAQH